MSDMSPQKNPNFNWEDSIKVVVEMMEEGDSWYSRHQPLTNGDYEKLLSLSSGGMTQVAHTLLLEAIKREVYLSFYSLQSKDELETRVFQVMSEILKREIPRVVENLNLSGSE
jgi:hypothetical protein